VNQKSKYTFVTFSFFYSAEGDGTLLAFVFFFLHLSRVKYNDFFCLIFLIIDDKLSYFYLLGKWQLGLKPGKFYCTSSSLRCWKWKQKEV